MSQTWADRQEAARQRCSSGDHRWCGIGTVTVDGERFVVEECRDCPEQRRVGYEEFFAGTGWLEIEKATP